MISCARGRDAGTLGFWDSAAIIFAIVVGVGIFRVPAEVARYLSSPVLMLAAWLAGGVVCLLGVLCFAELAAAFPASGGTYVYLRLSFGRCAAFLFGWTELTVIRTGSIASVAFIFAEYLQSFFAFDKLFVKSAAVVMVLLLSFVHLAGLRYGKRIQNICVFAKMAALIGAIAIGFLFHKGSLAHITAAPAPGPPNLLSAFGLALVPVLWTYGGWHENTFMAGETRDVTRTVPLALFFGIFAVAALYLIANFFFVYMIPAQRLAGLSLFAPEIFGMLFGRWGRKVFEALIIVSSLGCVNAMIMTGSRVTDALARDNALFASLGATATGNGVPRRAILFNGLWAVALIAWGTFNKLLFFTGVVFWIFIGLTAAGLIVLRRRAPGVPRPYRVWGYPFVPLLFAATCLFLTVNALIVFPGQSLFGLGLAASGIPLYLISRRRSDFLSRSREGMV